MAPDKGFRKQLKKLDPELEVVWDWGKEKWEIWRLAPNKPPIHMITVQTKDKSYRELGADVLVKLQAGDPTRYTLSQLCDYFDELDNQVRRRKEKAFRDKIKDIALDTFVNIHCKVIQVPQEYRVRRAITGA